MLVNLKFCIDFSTPFTFHSLAQGTQTLTLNYWSEDFDGRFLTKDSKMVIHLSYI